MKELIGRKIESIYVSGGEGAMTFLTDKGPLCYCVEGDCCSESWFADLTGFDALKGGTVASVLKVDIDDDDSGSRTRQKYDAVYGYNITTDKGHSSIVFRNSSNGYYGGWLCKPTENDDVSFMVLIEDDWSA